MCGLPLAASDRRWPLGGPPRCGVFFSFFGQRKRGKVVEPRTFVFLFLSLLYNPLPMAVCMCVCCHVRVCCFGGWMQDENGEEGVRTIYARVDHIYPI